MNLRFDKETSILQAKLGDITNKTGIKNKENEKYPVCSVNNIEGFILQSEQFEGSNLNSLSKTDYKIVNYGEVAYNPARINVGSFGLQELYEKTLVSSLYIVFKTKDGVNNHYLKQYMKTPIFNKRVKQNTEGSVREYLFYENFSNIKIYLPSLTEQKKVASFLDTFDLKIKKQQEKLSLIKIQKKGYMQKILKQEIRFKDEQGRAYPEWRKKVKADKLFESISNKNHDGNLPVLSATQSQGMVLRDLLNKDMQYSTNSLKSYKIVEIGDFVISLRSFQGGIELSHLKGLVSPAYTIFRKKDEGIYNEYFRHFFKTQTFINQLKTATYGIRDGKSISYKDFSTLKFDIPSYDEQKKIANFLSKLDEKIQIEQQKLKSLQEQKKGFMQRMFI
ncbi:restriction endonuclease subunit S [Bacillus cereus group sp. MYBK69-1]|uniref:restriction endonuclease subunit S n=1 Tax=unclassified Bacillus cereus group TaxID=2750818 RepID=UPI003F79EF62